MAYIEEVFTVSGVPEYTFVEPPGYAHMKVSIRTKGRCAVIEGPSGIGKTSSVTKILNELGISEKIIFLTARSPDDVKLIEELSSMDKIGVVIIDDFHRLSDGLKSKISDYMKILADRSDPDSKLILIGINKAGDRLVQYGSDVGLRIDVFKLDQNPDDLVGKLIELGEDVLNISIQDKDRIVSVSKGSFQIAQLLCNKICIDSHVTETQVVKKYINMSADTVIDRALPPLRMMFHDACIAFAQGTRLRREGRAPYLHILRWLTLSDEWSIDLRRAIRDYPEHSGSVGQVVSKGHLETLMQSKKDILSEFFHFQPENAVLTVEDPKLVFYLRSINWGNFVKEVGFPAFEFKGRYDLALSFAGVDRSLAKALFDKLSLREVSVFYDEEEQHRILSQNVETYLAPIYQSEATYIMPLLSAEYPNRIWTKFESDVFKKRFGENAIIPLRYVGVADSYFSDSYGVGSVTFDPAKDINSQADEIVETICKRLEEDKVDHNN